MGFAPNKLALYIDLHAAELALANRAKDLATMTPSDELSGRECALGGRTQLVLLT